MIYIRRVLTALQRWFDNAAEEDNFADGAAAVPESIDWPRVIPFIGLHLGCLAVVWVGWSAFAVMVALLLYLLRMFFITGFYHRYFSHRAYRTSRPMQFLFALLGNTAMQRGPLWWAAHHRLHHRHADSPEDVHSPRQYGFLQSHLGWFLTRSNFKTRLETVPDLARYRELRLLDRFDSLVPIGFGIGLYSIGEVLAAHAPELGTNGPQLFIWGFCISTVFLFNATFTVNSLAHYVGSRRYDTHDDSRNNFWLALITLGEGWHNNHHHFPGSARQGFFWWEIDMTYYALYLLQSLGLIYGLRPVPAYLRNATIKEQ